MPRTVPSALNTHYQNTSLTLATGLEFERTDGVKFYFTDLDQDITVNGSLHKAALGYDRTAISNSGLFKLDDIDIVGFFGANGVPLDDFRRGIFDHAKWCMYIFNFVTPGDGIDVIGTGRLGRTIVQPDGAYRIQLHRINEKPATHIIAKRYSPMCRADIGSSRADMGTEACTVPIEPPERANNTAYVVGDFIKAQTDGGGPQLNAVPIVNGGFDTGDMTGWTTLAGTLPTVVTTSDGLNPQAGTHYFLGFEDTLGGPGFYGAIEQVVDLTTTPNWVQAEADAGLYSFDFSAYRALADTVGSPSGRLLVQIRDSSDSVLLTVLDTGIETFPDDNAWRLRSAGSLTIPPNTDDLRILYEVHGGATGTRFRSSLDSVVATVIRPSNFARVSTSVAFVNPSFEASGGSPVSSWPTVSGNPRTVGAIGGLTPVNGTWMLSGNIPTSTSYMVEQIVDLQSDPLFDPVQADAGDYELNASVYQGMYAAQGDTGQVWFDALDASDVFISTIWSSSAHETLPIDTWEQIVAPSGQFLPSGTRKMRVRLQGIKGSGGVTSTAFDLLQVGYFRTTTFLPYSNYEDLIYEATTAGTTASTQPSFNASVGATTVDGGVTWKAYESWTRYAVVNVVTDDKQFTITFTDSRAVDDWFNDGYVRFDSGGNFQQVEEIRDWDQSSAEVFLFREMPYPVTSGDIIRIAPGCKLTRTDCRNKWIMTGSTNFENGNVLNFQGEPDLPGRDKVLRVGSSL